MQETELNVKRVIIDTTFNHNLWKEGYIRIQNNFFRAKSLAIKTSNETRMINEI